MKNVSAQRNSNASFCCNFKSSGSGSTTAFFEVVMAKKYSKKAEGKIAKVMKEGYAGKLHSGSKKGPLVTSPSQMKAIALSEARKKGYKVPKKK